MRQTTYQTHSVQETEALGESLACVLAQAPAVALYGGLGMGKTAFVRGLARGLGSHAQVSSPTFAIVNEYEGPRRICHFDMYRLPDAEALFDIGWEDYLASGALCVAEWSENVEGAFPQGTAEVIIRRLDDADGREITVKLC
ncbi:MAG: tRNA (adenosine(37)-N6)-threonylcarbamoyltransferase complex ATPase subunit type 1 TsaE [Clostridia bacterium]|nr:tRNA (adenosine(37)-N6)-threonylcarbamoyltransferase complex ATPase subunit type 1 TsaE [Clostridia bacterium]